MPATPNIRRHEGKVYFTFRDPKPDSRKIDTRCLARNMCTCHASISHVMFTASSVAAITGGTSGAGTPLANIAGFTG
jgi:hypothetical protein